MQDVAGQVRLIVAPTSVTFGSLPDSTTSVLGSPVNASELEERSPGAYTGFPLGSGKRINLISGTVTDLAGNGQFAIGRWTDGSDSAAGTYNAKQGRVWAVGTPVNVTLDPGKTLSCHLDSATHATHPTAANGNTAPGTLEVATATFTNSGAQPLTSFLDGHLSLQYSIGHDEHQTFAQVSPHSQGISLSRQEQFEFISRFVGADPTHPWYLLSYAIHAPSTGTISGIAALACTLGG